MGADCSRQAKRTFWAGTLQQSHQESRNCAVARSSRADDIDLKAGSEELAVTPHCPVKSDPGCPVWELPHLIAGPQIETLITKFYDNDRYT